MDEIKDLNTGLEVETINRSDKRIKDLSQKVELTAKERDEEVEARKKVETERDNVTKERDFYQSFSDLTSKYPAASEYKTQIMEKVKLGYSPDDATVSVLAREGRLTSQTSQPQRESPVGGSATNTISGGGKKSLGEMTRDEKRQALIDAEQKGEISMQ